MALHDILAFSWNDIFPTRPQTGADLDLVNETFTFNGGGDVVTYNDRDGDRNELGDNNSGLNDRITGTIDGVSVDELINPEYSYTILDSNGVAVGNMFALTKATNALSSIEAFAFDFRPVPGETYTVSSHDGTPPSTPYSELICFADGTSIATENGPMPVEDLEVGTRVLTLDAGFQPIRWIGKRRVTAREMLANPKLRPVRIRQEALGGGLPERDLLVSRQHRIVMRNAVAERMFGSYEILIAAIKLISLPGIDIDDTVSDVTYYHFLFDRHHVVYANGSLAESMFTGPRALNALSPEALDEIRALFPSLIAPDLPPVPARLVPEPSVKMKKLVSRMAKNAIPVQDVY